MPTSRVAFALACVLGIVLIAVGAGLEINRYNRGGGLVSRQQFRLRLISAATWIASLATFFWAVTWLWPDAAPVRGAVSPLALAQAKRFMLVVLGALALVIIALFLLVVDVWQTGLTRRLIQARAQASRAALAREEIAKLTDKDVAPGE